LVLGAVVTCSLWRFNHRQILVWASTGKELPERSGFDKCQEIASLFKTVDTGTHM